MNGEYEFLFNVSAVKKPLKASDVMAHLNNNNIFPIAVRVDNVLGQIIVYFEHELSDSEKKKLDDIISRFIKSL